MARSAPTKAPAVVDQRRVQGERTRKRIITYGVKLAASEGFESVTVGRLAEDLKMSKSGLFASFGSKDALLFEIYRASVGSIVAPLSEAFRKRRGLERLVAVCETVIREVTSTRPGYQSFVAHGFQFTTTNGAIAAELHRARRWWRDALRRLIREAQESGQIDRKADVELMAWKLDVTCLGAGNVWQLDRDPKSARLARRAVKDILAAATPRAAAITAAATGGKGLKRSASRHDVHGHRP